MAQKPTPAGQQGRRIPLHQQSVRQAATPAKPDDVKHTEPTLPEVESWDDEEPTAPPPPPEEPVKVPPPIDVGAGKPLNKVPAKFRKLL